MNHKRYLVLTDEEFGTSIRLTRTDDLLESYAEAEHEAEQSIKNGSTLTYLFELRETYIPSGSRRQVPVFEVELLKAHQGEAYGGTD